MSISGAAEVRDTSTAYYTGDVKSGGAPAAHLQRQAARAAPKASGDVQTITPEQIHKAVDELQSSAILIAFQQQERLQQH